MLTGSINSMRQERAAKASDIEYLREMAREDAIDDRMMQLDNSLLTCDSSVIREATEAVDKIPTDDNFRQQEQNRILNATHDLTFDQMIGIE